MIDDRIRNLRPVTEERRKPRLSCNKFAGRNVGSVETNRLIEPNLLTRNRVKDRSGPDLTNTQGIIREPLKVRTHSVALKLDQVFIVGLKSLLPRLADAGSSAQMPHIPHAERSEAIEYSTVDTLQDRLAIPYG